MSRWVVGSLGCRVVGRAGKHRRHRKNFPLRSLLSLRLCVTLGVLGVNFFALSASLLSLRLCISLGVLCALGVLGLTSVLICVICGFLLCVFASSASLRFPWRPLHFFALLAFLGVLGVNFFALSASLLSLRLCVSLGVLCALGVLGVNLCANLCNLCSFLFSVTQIFPDRFSLRVFAFFLMVWWRGAGRQFRLRSGNAIRRFSVLAA